MFDLCVHVAVMILCWKRSRLTKKSTTKIEEGDYLFVMSASTHSDGFREGSGLAMPLASLPSKILVTCANKKQVNNPNHPGS